MTGISSEKAATTSSTTSWAHTLIHIADRTATISRSGAARSRRQPVGDFNAWNPDATPMKPVADSGIYELFVPGLGVGQLYKFAITTHTGTILFKADPYAFSAEYRPGTASVTADIRGFKWNDSKWMESRAGTDPVKAPISIYEVHLGSWKRKPPGKGRLLHLHGSRA